MQLTTLDLLNSEQNPEVCDPARGKAGQAVTKADSNTKAGLIKNKIL